MMPDKRLFHRILYNADANLSFEDQSWPCQIVDLCLKGCLLKFDSNWFADPDRMYTLNFKLSDDVQIQMDLKVSHAINESAGFKCENIDLESITALRRLIELNLGDSDLLERDLQALANNNHSSSMEETELN